MGFDIFYEPLFIRLKVVWYKKGNSLNLKDFCKNLIKQEEFLLTLSLFCGKVMQTVEKEQVVSVQLFSESRRG